LCAYLREQQTLSEPKKREDGVMTCEIVPDEVAAHAADVIQELWERLQEDWRMNPVMAFPFKDSEFGLQRMSMLDYLAANAPVTFEMAMKSWGDEDVNLVDDGNRKAFFAMWAYLTYEYAEAMMEERSDRQE